MKKKIEKPKLASSEFVFIQDGNTLGSTTDIEEINISLQTQTAGESPFLVIRTDGWSFDTPEELNTLIADCLNTMTLADEEE